MGENKGITSQLRFIAVSPVDCEKPRQPSESEATSATVVIYLLKITLFLIDF